MMRRFVLLLYFLFISRYLLTLGSSDHTSKSTTTRSGGYEGKTKTKVLCQGETLNIACPFNFLVVFDDANFGRGPSDNNKCITFYGFEIQCENHQKTLAVLNVRCREEQKCILPVNKSIFGNPCFGITKYLEVKYHFLCERETMNITCPNNSVIVFEDANFGRGRSDSQRCRQFWGFESIPCDNHEQTLKVLDDKCHEKQQCILPVTKAIFGNPCQGFTQYLYVNYHCKRKGNHAYIFGMFNYHIVDILESEGNYKPEYILGIESSENDNTSRKKSRSHQTQTGFIRFKRKRNKRRTGYTRPLNIK